MNDYQILLLPKQDYYIWVAASSDYVQQYRANLTSDPDTAGRYMYPNQVITVVNPPDHYGRDISEWFQQNYAGARLDVISAVTPEDLEKTLATRLSSNDRYGKEGQRFVLRWPTSYLSITQPFGVNQDLYRRWGLPGHEGLDIRAPLNSNIYACADGTVYRVHDGSRDHPYGIHVRLQHRDGYRTIYAHLSKILVTVGQAVQTGERIGLADSTGNSTGSHLHLTLKKKGASQSGLTNFPHDVLDPTPFLQFPENEAELPGDPIEFAWQYGRCLVGLHGRADGPLLDPDIPLIKNARIEAVKLLSNAPPEDVDRLLKLDPEMFIMARLFASFRDRVVSAADFTSWIEHDMGELYERGVRFFEIHNEPNLQYEGWHNSWPDGHQFGHWFLELVERLQSKYSKAKFGYPGLSPGGPISGQRMDSWTFLEQSDEAARSADWIGCHCYWSDEAHMLHPSGGLVYEEYRRRYPDKLLFITEFSNPTKGTDARTKGQQYLEYYRRLQNVRGIGAAFSFVVSASSDFPHEVWRSEDGTSRGISELVGQRGF